MLLEVQNVERWLPWGFWVGHYQESLSGILGRAQPGKALGKGEASADIFGRSFHEDRPDSDS